MKQKDKNVLRITGIIFILIGIVLAIVGIIVNDFKFFIRTGIFFVAALYIIWRARAGNEGGLFYGKRK